MTRREFSRSVKLAAFKRADGRCEECTAYLVPGRFEYDHDLADGLGGEPTLENCIVRCDSCHVRKTASEDVPRMAKADRARRKIMDGEKRTTRPIPGSKASGWRKRMNGQVERRQ